MTYTSGPETPNILNYGSEDVQYLPVSSEPLFEVVSKLNRRIRINRSYWDYIVRVKHPSMRGLDEVVKSSLIEPIEVRRSRRDQSVHLHYGKFKATLLVCTVVKFLNGDGFVITAHLTRRMIGDPIWKQKQ
jgi:hypothetical protein